MTATGEQRKRIERWLAEIREGNDQARDALFDFVYNDLRKMAANLLVKERDEHTLQPTALVHETYLKIFVGTPLKTWDRAYFFAALARAMRQLLVDHARKRRAAKRPDNKQRVPLDDILTAFESSQHLSILDLESSLQELRAANERHYEVVVLRFFGGLGWKEIAQYLNVSVSTAEKDWQVCRAWLFTRLRSSR